MRCAIRGSLYLSALFAAITPLHALAAGLPPGVSDILEITDDAGTPVIDGDGKPAVAMILESAEVTSGSVIPGYRPRSSAFVTLTVGDFTPLRSQLTSFVLSSGSPSTFDLIDIWTSYLGGIQVNMCSGDCPRLYLPPGANAGIHSITETGEPQEIDVLPSPIGSGNLQVIVDSIDAVPEPSTVLMLAAGLGTLSTVRRKRAT